MQNLKKIISLKQAAKISGYTQDYLGFLIRSGEIKGQKMGGSWFTTQEEINNYFFKRKVRQNKFAFREFFSQTRFRQIIIFSLVVIITSTLIICSIENNKDDIFVDKNSEIRLDDNIEIIN